VLDEDEIDEESVVKCSVDVERKLDALAALKLHAGPGFVQRNIRNGNRVQQVQEKEVRFIFDQDVYSTAKVKVPAVAETLNALHALTASFPTRSPPCSTTQWSRNICKSDVI